MPFESQRKKYKKDYYAGKKVIAMVVPAEEAAKWKHNLGLGPLAKELMRAYFAGKIKLEL